MYNKIILAGHLTRDIELKYTQSGSAIGNTAIATSRKFKSQTGEQKEEVLFVDITLFGRLAEIGNQYLRKGSKVLVDGRLKLDKWKAQDGSNRSKHSVVVENLQMLGSKDEAKPMEQKEDDQPQYTYDDGNGNETPMTPPPGTSNQPSSNIPEIDINSEEIPF